MTRAKFLVAATALASVLSVRVQAQVIVLDPQALVKDGQIAVSTAQTVENGYHEIAAMVHGNGFGITSLVPGLDSGIASNPLGADAGAAASLMSGVGNGGGMSGIFSRFLGQTQTYTPAGNDPEAQMLTQRADAAAGQMTIGQQFMNGSAARLSLLPALVNTLTGTADIKDAMDANTRVNAEQMTQGAQASQLQALAIYQQAEQNAERSREELRWRQGADAYATQSQAAADAAAGGAINLVNN